MKKSVGIFLVSLGALLCIVALVFLDSYKSNREVNYLRYEIISNGYSDYKSKIISTYDQYLELIDYMNEENRKYGKVYNFDKDNYTNEYFNSKSLAIINIVTGSGMNKLKSIKVYTNNDTLYYDLDIDYAEGFVTTDINGKLLLVEIDKNITYITLNGH